MTEREILLKEIKLKVLEEHKKHNVPMPFKTEDCLKDEFYLRDLNTGAIKKVKVIASDGGTKVIDL